MFSDTEKIDSYFRVKTHSCLPPYLPQVQNKSETLGLPKSLHYFHPSRQKSVVMLGGDETDLFSNIFGTIENVLQCFSNPGVVLPMAPYLHSPLN